MVQVDLILSKGSLEGELGGSKSGKKKKKDMIIAAK